MGNIEMVEKCFLELQLRLTYDRSTTSGRCRHPAYIPAMAQR